VSGNIEPLSKMLEVMIIQCQIILYRLSDMQDWYAIMKGAFKKKNLGFNLNDSIQKIYRSMIQKAESRGINLILYAPFTKEGFLVDQVNYQSLIQNVLTDGLNLIDRPLFKRLYEFDFRQSLPFRVIGDRDRFEQMAINIIVNSIQHT
jgi:signal transduction histidine kinase